MSKITLTRVVKDHAVTQDGRVVLVEDVKALVLKMRDGAGREVSLAFDGRADRSDTEFGCERCEEYSIYADDPVRLDNRSVRGLTVLRALRDALNELDL